MTSVNMYNIVWMFREPFTVFPELANKSQFAAMRLKNLAYMKHARAKFLRFGFVIANPSKRAEDIAMNQGGIGIAKHIHNERLQPSSVHPAHNIQYRNQFASPH